MRDIFEIMSQRRSYRGKYLPDPVPREHLIKIMQAGKDAPSGCNKQTARFIAVDDPNVLGQLHAVIDPPLGETAPAMIVVVSRPLAAYRDRLFNVQDYSAAIQNMLIAIEALGYSSCWIEGHITDTDRICDKMAEILDVPDEMEVVCYLPVGKAADSVQPPVKRSFNERAFFNRYGNND